MPVLMYHSVPRQSPAQPNEHAVPVAELTDQLTSLTEAGWRLLGLTEALAAKDADASARVVGVTFDDGLLDFLNAVEVIQGLGARATMYVPTDDVGLQLAPDDPHGSRLSWTDLADVARAGIEIGSHSAGHRPMDVLRPADLAHELVGSKKALEDHLGLPVESFCYPHGYSSSRVHKAAQRAGYSNACIVGRRIARSTDDVFAVPRLHVRPGVTGAAFDQLLAEGEPGLAPKVKRLANPAWRLARQVAFRVGHREIT
jgi:peptidoglycan/xylan/chitin deacetylase (PgdA/CDA1 family)